MPDDAVECRMSDDDEESVHSAFSNESEFVDDEEDAEYLVLELVHHLPAEKADRLLKSFRAKEKSYQDLVARYQKMVNLSTRVDKENEALTERVDELEALAARVQELEEQVAAPTSSRPAVSVDNSYFLQMERGKEETILRLKADNEKMIAQVHRFDEANKHLDEALQQARADIRRLQAGRHAAEHRPEPRAVSPHATDLLDEEDKLWTQLKGDSDAEIARLKWERQHELLRSRVQASLDNASKDASARVQGWGSDVTAILLAVDGVESQLRQALKDLKPGKRGATSGPATEYNALEAAAVDIREIRGLGKKLISSLDEGSKATTRRLAQVTTVLAGDAKAQKNSGNPAAAVGPGTPRGGVTESEAGSAAKKKRSKKKGSGGAGGAGAAGGASISRTEQEEQLGKADESCPTPKVAAATATSGANAARDSTELTEPVSPSKKAGAELMQQLNSLRKASDALEDRMAARLRARCGSQTDEASGGEPGAGEKPAATARRRKKMYA